MTIKELQSRIDKHKGEYGNLSANIAEHKVELRLKEKYKDDLEKCIDLLSYICSLNQNKIIDLFQHTISAGLKDLFDDSYEFNFELKTRGNSSACDFKIRTSEFPAWTNLVMCHGKSVQEIIAVIKRIILVKLDKRTRNIVILDEPLSGVELDRQSKTSSFLSEICKRFDIQLIVITHSEQLMECCDKVIKING